MNEIEQKELLLACGGVQKPKHYKNFQLIKGKYTIYFAL